MWVLGSVLDMEVVEQNAEIKVVVVSEGHLTINFDMSMW